MTKQKGRLRQVRRPMSCLACMLIIFNKISGVLPNSNANEPIRLLYVVTTMNEYNTGRKATRKGTDRLGDLVIPVLREGVKSMIAAPYHYQVDVYMILGYTLKQARIDMIRNQLPESVGLELWQDATPLTYDIEPNGENDGHVRLLTRSLARQHRYVIKDKFLDYDFFLAFEDDMLIKGEHVHQYLVLTDELERLRSEAPESVKENQRLTRRQITQRFYGPLNKHQLSRMIPSFIRVEVLLEGNEISQTSARVDPIPIDLQFTASGNTTEERQVDPQTCCHVKNISFAPKTPTYDRLFIWETGIRALGIRQMPESSPLSWVMLHRGNRAKFMDDNELIGDYWSGRDGDYEKEFRRPFEGEPWFISNQGGWMATRSQIWEWHTTQCKGGFLPPFDQPVFKDDGLYGKNVEYWSGGLQISQSSSCNLQRIVSLNPDLFSRHLIYHTANNKQIELRAKKQRFVKANDFLGQLNTVRKRAEKQKAKEEEQAKSWWSWI